MNYITKTIKKYLVDVYKLEKDVIGKYDLKFVGQLEFDSNPTDAYIKRVAYKRLGIEREAFIKFEKKAHGVKRRMKLDDFLKYSEIIEE